MKVVSSAQSLRQELAQVSRSLTDRKAQQGHLVGFFRCPCRRRRVSGR